MTLFAAVGAADLPRKLYDRLEAEAAETDEKDKGPRALFARGATQSHRNWLKMDRERQKLRHQWAEYFKKKDLLLCPAAPVPAFPHDHDEFYGRTLPVNNEDRSYVKTLYTWSGLAGVTQLPATVVPAGISPEGLPVGAQIVGPYLNDRTTIQMAGFIEDETGGFVPPSESS